ncbi:MAG: hypothetical protein ACP5IN_03710 [Caldimicrobium sp.]
MLNANEKLLKKKNPKSLKKKNPLRQKVKKALINLWKISYFPSGKRLKAILPKIITKLKFFNEFTFEKEVEEKLLKISVATIDSILSSEKEKLSLKERSKTKPGTLIKKLIPVRIFNKWDEKRPGFMGNFFTLYVQLWCIVDGRSFLF